MLATSTYSNCTQFSNSQVGCPNLSGLTNGLIVFFIVMAVVYAVIIAFVVWAEVKILNKAGYSGWWALSMLVPIFGIVMFFVFAFSDWPVLQQLRAVSAGQTFGYAGAPPGPGVPGPGMPWGASGPGGPWGAPGPFPSSPGLPPPGWYPGEVQGQERYWDGVAWTSQVRASEPPRT